MDFITGLVVVAVLVTLGVLVSGLSSMATGGPVGHRASVEWMTYRVAWQGLAFLLILLAIYTMN
jgi:hypothetical protein